MTPEVKIAKIDNNYPQMFHQLEPGSYFIRESKLWTNVVYKKYNRTVKHDELNAIIVAHPDPQFIGVHENIPCDAEVSKLKSLRYDVKYSI